MARNRGTSILAAVALIASLGCGLFKSKPAPPPASESADETTRVEFKPVKLEINNESVGSTSDLTELKKTIREIMNMREERGVFKNERNEPANDVFLWFGPQLPSGIIADLALAINENGGKTRIPLPSGRSTIGNGVKPNPLTLVVSAVGTTGEGLGSWRIDDDDRYSTAPTFEVTDDKTTILLARAYGGLEISANGEYFVNDHADLASTRRAEDVKLLQRAVTVDTIKSEGLKLMSAAANPNELTVLISEVAQTESVLRLFALFDGTDVQWHIVVRKPVKEKP